jgi:hypothetical protein
LAPDECLYEWLKTSPVFSRFLKIGLVASLQRRPHSSTGYAPKNRVLLAFFEKQKIRLLANRQKTRFSMDCFTRPISADFARGKRQFGRIGLF